MNSIITSDDASEESEFLSALNASLESFVHKALKDEQRECIHRIVCHGRDVLAVLRTGLGKSAIRERYISVNFKFKCCQHQKPLQNSLFFVGLQSGTVPSPSSCFRNLLNTNETGGRVLQNKPCFCRPHLTYSTTCIKFTLFAPCVIPAHGATSDNFAWFILIWRWHCRHSHWQIF